MPPRCVEQESQYSSLAKKCCYDNWNRFEEYPGGPAVLHAPTPAFCHLPLHFDPERLRADLDRVGPAEWVPHYNERDYEGAWHVAALRSVGGKARRGYADPAPAEPFADTPLLETLPYLRAVLGRFECPLRAARLLRLGAGARIREHRDHTLGLEHGEARLHVPVTSNPDVEFVVDGRRLVMNPGETWYVDVTLPHRVANRGATDRVHLVIDCGANDWLRAMLPPEDSAGANDDAAAPAVPIQDGGFDAFRQLVLRDARLQAELCEFDDPESFTRAVVRLGMARGYRFAAADVEDALRAARRSWLERRIV